MRKLKPIGALCRSCEYCKDGGRCETIINNGDKTISFKFHCSKVDEILNKPLVLIHTTFCPYFKEYGNREDVEIDVCDAIKVTDCTAIRVVGDEQ